MNHLNDLRIRLNRPIRGIGKYSYSLRILTFVIVTLLSLSYTHRTLGLNYTAFLLIITFLYPFLAHWFFKLFDPNGKYGYALLIIDAILLGFLSGLIGYSYIVIGTLLTGVVMNSLFFVGFKRLPVIIMSFLFGIVVSYISIKKHIQINTDKLELEETVILIFAFCYYSYSAYLVYVSATRFNNTRRALKIKHNDVASGLKYAGKIQTAVFKSEEHETLNFPEHFVFFKPKNIVSGDFYWALEKENYMYISVADCSSEGVSGAFLTMLGISFLDQINAVPETLAPDQILDQLHARFIHELSSNEHTSGEGMDIALARLNLNTRLLEITSTNLTTYVVRGNQVIMIAGDDQSIGHTSEASPYELNRFQLQQGDTVYLSTNGLRLEFERLEQQESDFFSRFLIDLSKLPIQEQKNKLNTQYTELNTSKSLRHTANDICFIGIEL